MTVLFKLIAAIVIAACMLERTNGRVMHDRDWQGNVKIAIRDGDSYGLGYLLMKMDKEEAHSLINSEFCGELTPLQYAAKTNTATIDVLLDAGAKPNLAHKATHTTPLMFAARSGETTTVEKLLEVLTMEEVNALDEHHSTALALTCLSCNEQLARTLMYAGANPFQVDVSGNTALHVAAWYCQDKPVAQGFALANVLLGLTDDLEDPNPTDRDPADEEELLRAVNLMSGSGRTALMLAAKRGGGSIGVYDALMSVGADAETIMSSLDQKTALDFKLEREEQEQSEGKRQKLNKGEL